MTQPAAESALTREPALTRELAGRVVLVTGGAVRLGRAIGLAFARRGASVAFTWHRSGDAAARTLKELEAVAKGHGAGALALPCDVTQEADVDRAFESLDRELGGIDVLVNNAGVFEATPFAEWDLAGWQRQLDVNLTGPMICAKRAGDRMLAGGRDGLIVNIACAGGERPWPRHAAYCSSKAGLIMLTRVLARDLAPRVRVNAIAPGPVLLPEGYDAKQREASVKRTVLRREGSPDDVARAALFCWDSDYTTGALIPVEGGRLIL